jgi:hypothetical protein
MWPRLRVPQAEHRAPRRQHHASQLRRRRRPPRSSGHGSVTHPSPQCKHAAPCCLRQNCKPHSRACVVRRRCYQRRPNTCQPTQYDPVSSKTTGNAVCAVLRSVGMRTVIRDWKSCLGRHWRSYQARSPHDTAISLTRPPRAPSYDPWSQRNGMPLALTLSFDSDL